MSRYHHDVGGMTHFSKCGDCHLLWQNLVITIAIEAGIAVSWEPKQKRVIKRDAALQLVLFLWLSMSLVECTIILMDFYNKHLEKFTPQIHSHDRSTSVLVLVLTNTLFPMDLSDFIVGPSYGHSTPLPSS